MPGASPSRVHRLEDYLQAGTPGQQGRLRETLIRRLADVLMIAIGARYLWPH